MGLVQTTDTVLGIFSGVMICYCTADVLFYYRNGIRQSAKAHEINCYFLLNFKGQCLRPCTGKGLWCCC